MGRSVPVAVSFALLYISIASALPNHGLAAPERQPGYNATFTYSNMTATCDPSSTSTFPRTTECSNATAAASSNATTTFSPTTLWRHRPMSKSEPCDGKRSDIRNASSHTRTGWKKPCPTCQTSEEVSRGHTAHHVHHAEQPHHLSPPHHEQHLHRQPHPQHDRPQNGPRPRPGAGRHSPPSSTSGNSTLLGHTTHTGHHPGIEISTSISVNLTLPTLPTYSRPRPTKLLAVIENLQVLEESSSLPGATGTIRHAPFPEPPAAGLAGGSDSRVVPGFSETVTAPLERFTDGVERVMVSKLGGCLAGLVGVVALLA
jgi:hypothetical protein